MTDNLILITGSTDGIGYQTAFELAKLGYHVIIHGRNQKKAEITVKKIESLTHSNNLSYVYADLVYFRQIKEMADQLHEKFDKLDVLINNAGLYRPEKHITQEGLEETFAVNYLAPFFLTNLLIDLLKNSQQGRIVNVASRVHSNHFDFDNLQFEHGYTGVKAYAKSKTALILFTYFLADKLSPTRITVNCLHPGAINTKILKAAIGLHGTSLHEGAKTLIYAATAPELENISGKYFVNNRIKNSKDITYNKQIQKKLWQKSKEIIDINTNSN
ncbi:MAG: SDR family oxidoreductase [Candidatus Thorarchaeota archaeon]